MEDIPKYVYERHSCVYPSPSYDYSTSYPVDEYKQDLLEDITHRIFSILKYIKSSSTKRDDLLPIGILFGKPSIPLDKDIAVEIIENAIIRWSTKVTLACDWQLLADILHQLYAVRV